MFLRPRKSKINENVRRKNNALFHRILNCLPKSSRFPQMLINNQNDRFELCPLSFLLPSLCYSNKMSKRHEMGKKQRLGKLRRECIYVVYEHNKLGSDHTQTSTLLLYHFSLLSTVFTIQFTFLGPSICTSSTISFIPVGQLWLNTVS